MKNTTPTIHVKALPRAVLSPDSSASIKKNAPLTVNSSQPIRTRFFDDTGTSSHPKTAMSAFVSGNVDVSSRDVGSVHIGCDKDDTEGPTSLGVLHGRTFGIVVENLR